MSVRAGIDVLLDQQSTLVKGQRVGLIASPSSVDHELNSSIDRLRQHPGVDLVALFGPEHGIRGSAQAGDHVATSVDPVIGLPAYSLYGDTKQPTPEMLAGIDALVYDLRDGGVRFYTYLSTLVYALKASAEQGIPLIVLDRPNPISGFTPEGALLDPAYTSFVGMAPVPMRHAMTAGESSSCATMLEIGAHAGHSRQNGWLAARDVVRRNRCHSSSHRPTCRRWTR
ncbi:MAG: DUF1343 domain-containing protein [Anaerolineae bacterium]